MNSIDDFLGLTNPTAGTLPSNAVILPSSEQVDNRVCAETLAAKLTNSGIYSFNGLVVEATRGPNGEIELSPLRAEGAATRFQQWASFWAWRRPDGKPVLAPVPKPPFDTMKELLAGGVLAARLRKIVLVSPCPILVETPKGEIEILGPGYHAAHGVLIYENAPAATENLSIGEAVNALLELTEEYGFATPGDRARMIADYITPALVMGDILGAQAPISVTEANESQSGKGYHQKNVRALYRARVAHITQRKGGVGSLDEDFSAAVIRAQTFISIDNYRGPLNSPLIEAGLTSENDLVQVRVPYSVAVFVSLRRRVVQLTSNGFETTPDLANRANLVCIRKLTEHLFRQYPEGDLSSHVVAQQSYYLGCVFTLIKAWHNAGKPCNSGTGHDRRRWAGVIDWILMNPFMGLVGELMSGHAEVKERLSNPNLGWLRKVCVAMEPHGPVGGEYLASDLAVFCSTYDIEIPGRGVEEDGARAVGVIMKNLFAKSRGSSLSVEGYLVERTQTEERGADRHSHVVNRYQFTSLRSLANHGASGSADTLF